FIIAVSFVCVRYDYCDVGIMFFFFFQAEDGIRDSSVTGVQTCALPISAQAEGSLITRSGQVIGSALIGQEFKDDKYFHGRLSATTAADPNDSTKTVPARSEEHTSELQSHLNLVCRLLLEKKKTDDMTDP